MEIKATVQGDNWGILIHPDWQQNVRDRGLSLAEGFSPALFHAEHYQSEAVKVGDGGRNAAWFIPTSIGPAVLRQYRRGGLVGKFIKSTYVFRGKPKLGRFKSLPLTI